MRSTILISLAFACASSLVSGFGLVALPVLSPVVPSQLPPSTLPSVPLVTSVNALMALYSDVPGVSGFIKSLPSTPISNLSASFAAAYNAGQLATTQSTLTVADQIQRVSVQQYFHFPNDYPADHYMPS